MSFDTPSSNAAFAQNQGFQYELWSDTQKTLAKYYGANGVMPQRVTRLLDAEGTLIVSYAVGGGINNHPQSVLEDCQAIFGD